ncbi:MAG: 16S rRNA processing protein RimM, partial [Ferruginibacter sp.]
MSSYGLAGELLLAHKLGKKTALKGLKTLFLEEGKNSFLPYFIENAVAKNDEEILVKLEGIHSKETAKKITSKEVWLAENDFKKFAAKAAPISMLGFTLFDGKNSLGEITEVIEQPHQ